MRKPNVVLVQWRFASFKTVCLDQGLLFKTVNSDRCSEAGCPEGSQKLSS